MSLRLPAGLRRCTCHRRRVTIVGVATMPAVGSSGNLHTSMGVGAEVAASIEPPAFQAALHNPDANLDGPTMSSCGCDRGVRRPRRLASLREVVARSPRIMRADPTPGSATYEVLGPQRPAEITIYQSTGATPVVLALGLVAGAIVALALALTASVRRRRRDLALLKTLGFTRRQLAGAIAWQSSVIARRRGAVRRADRDRARPWLWDLFARQIAAVPEPRCPAAQVVRVALAAVALANAVAAVPGRIAARTPAAARAAERVVRATTHPRSRGRSRTGSPERCGHGRPGTSPWRSSSASWAGRRSPRSPRRAARRRRTTRCSSPRAPPTSSSSPGSTAPSRPATTPR